MSPTKPPTQKNQSAGVSYGGFEIIPIAAGFAIRKGRNLVCTRPTEAEARAWIGKPPTKRRRDPYIACFDDDGSSIFNTKGED